MEGGHRKYFAATPHGPMFLLTVFAQLRGEIVDIDRLPKTRILTLKGWAQHYPQPEMMSQYFAYSGMHRVTDNKRGGAREHHYRDPAASFEDIAA